MAKFNRPNVRSRADGPVTTTGPATTYEGGAAFTRDPLSELVLLAVVNMVGEDTFYESADTRDTRFAVLCREIAVNRPADFLHFVRWLRGEANMRSASLVAAAEGVKARLHERDLSVVAGERPGDADGLNRKIVNAVLQRPDEPGEFLAYWTANYGRALPKPVKRGVADAVTRLYHERSLLKYDTASHGWRFADVLDLVHPSPRAPWQGDLFAYALNRRTRAVSPKGHPEQIPESLGVVARNRSFPGRVEEAPYLAYDSEAIREAGLTWEDVLSQYGSKVDKAKLWEAMIPNMGIMALIRNLRNFDEAKVSDKAAQLVISELQDPEQIAKSRQFPYRFLSAYRAAPSLRWGHALETALHASMLNVPEFTGRTLVLIDTSASMRQTVSAKSQVRHVDVAALVGLTFAHRSRVKSDVIGFADNAFRFDVSVGGSVLRDMDAFDRCIGSVGHGTNTVAALQATYNGHDRVIICHDGQYGSFAYAWPTLSTSLPAHVPLFSIDTSGYQASAVDTSEPNRYEIGGFSDKLFTMVKMLDSGRSTKWPWQQPTVR
jgi:hypothetical protein